MFGIILKNQRMGILLSASVVSKYLNSADGNSAQRKHVEIYSVSHISIVIAVNIITWFEHVTEWFVMTQSPQYNNNITTVHTPRGRNGVHYAHNKRFYTLFPLSSVINELYEVWYIDRDKVINTRNLKNPTGYELRLSLAAIRNRRQSDNILRALCYDKRTTANDKRHDKRTTSEEIDRSEIDTRNQ